MQNKHRDMNRDIIQTEVAYCGHWDKSVDCKRALLSETKANARRGGHNYSKRYIEKFQSSSSQYIQQSSFVRIFFFFSLFLFLSLASSHRQRLMQRMQFPSGHATFILKHILPNISTSTIYNNYTHCCMPIHSYMNIYIIWK